MEPARSKAARGYACTNRCAYVYVYVNNDPVLHTKNHERAPIRLACGVKLGARRIPIRQFGVPLRRRWRALGRSEDSSLLVRMASHRKLRNSRALGRGQRRKKGYELRREARFAGGCEETLGQRGFRSRQRAQLVRSKSRISSGDAARHASMFVATRCHTSSPARSSLSVVDKMLTPQHQCPRVPVSQLGMCRGFSTDRNPEKKCSTSNLRSVLSSGSAQLFWRVHSLWAFAWPPTPP